MKFTRKRVTGPSLLSAQQSQSTVQGLEIPLSGIINLTALSMLLPVSIFYDHF